MQDLLDDTDEGCAEEVVDEPQEWDLRLLDEVRNHEGTSLSS